MESYASHQDAGQPEPSWMKVLSRLGYGAKGIVYLVIGGVSLQGGTSGGSTDALTTIDQQPFGQFLLVFVAVGLAAYASWRLVQASIDPEDEGEDTSAVAKRISYAASGLVYVGLAISAVQIVFGQGSGGSGAQDWTARVLELSFGRWLVGLLGLAVIAAGIYQLKEAITAGFKDKFALDDMDSTQTTWAVRAGRIGHGARSVVYGIIGWFLIRAAITHSASQSGGLGEALSTLQQQPYGRWLLGFAGLGLFCYGIYCLVLGRYHKAAN